MIRVENLHKSFDGVWVLRGISFELGKGEVMALIGRSGYGKSVLLKHLAGLMRPDQGRVLVDGRDVAGLRGGDLLRMRSRLGFLFQSGALFDSMTIFDNVAFPLREKTRLPEEEVRRRVFFELEQVGLIGSENKHPSQVSGGMVKRASLARALILEPEIMLFDEPTTGLDPITGRNILNLIESCHRRLCFTGVIVTHEIPRVFEIVDRVAMVEGGLIAFYGTPEEILLSRDPVVLSLVYGEEGESGVDAECREAYLLRIKRKKEIHLR
jgi:phospholipid/cholesterol/gamma-HCH transport system ATP-binding protein